MLPGASWLGDYLSRAIAWVGRVINALAAFLPAFATYLIDAVVRPAIHHMATDLVAELVSGLLAASFALTAMLIAAFDHLYATTRRALGWTASSQAANQRRVATAVAARFM